MALLLQSLDIILLGLLAVGVGLYYRANLSRQARLRQRALAEVQRQGRDAAPQHPLSAIGLFFKRQLRRLGSAIPLLNEAQRVEASGSLVAAGYRSNQALFVFAGIILLCMLAFTLITVGYARSFLNEGGVLYWFVAVVVCIYMGTFIPRFVLDLLVKRRQEAIRLALPDALDLLVITTNAGLALNAALDRVANELGATAPELSDELKLTVLQLRISSEVDEVLQGLANRTNLDSVRSLVTTLKQARQYGTSITQALRVLAQSERTARMMHLEEQAAKLAVKITLPMMIFILPTVLIVAAGPAILSMIETFSSM